MVELSENLKKKLEKSREERIKIQPKNSGLVKDLEENDFNFFQTLQDMAASVPEGVINYIEEAGDFIDENIISTGGVEIKPEAALLLADPLAASKYAKEAKSSFQDFIPTYITPKRWKEEEYSKKRNLPSFHKPKTAAGKMTEGVSRFITGFVGPSKFLKGAGLTGGATKIAARGMAAGAVSDLTGFDPNEGRLSDMLIEFDSDILNNAVTQYLATDEDDTEMEGRIKNVLEGMVFGGIAEGAVFAIKYGIKGFKKMKGTKNIEEKSKIQKQTSLVIEDAMAGKKTVRRKKFETIDNPAIDTNEAVKVIKATQATAKKESEMFISKILNTKSFKSAGHVMRTIDSISETLMPDDVKNYLENDVLSNETAEELATLLSRDKDEILASITKEGVRAKDGVIRMLATKQTLQSMAEQAQETAKKYLKEFGDDTDFWSNEAMKEMALIGDVLQKTVYSLKQTIRGAAQTTQAGRVAVGKSGKIFDVEEMANMAKNFNANPAVLAKKFANAKPEEIIHAATKSRGSKAVEVLNSLYINSLLSGGYTHAVNFLSNSYELFLRPLVTSAGGLARADLKTFRYGFSQYVGMATQFGETWKMVRLAMKQGDAILDPIQRTQDNLEIIGGRAVRPISGSNLGFNGILGKATDVIGFFAELPTRLLMAGDEIFKQLNFRGRLYAEAMDNSLENGLKIGSKEYKANFKKIFDDAFTKTGRANIDESDIAARSLEYARISTYTNTLKGGAYIDIGGAIQSFLNRAPYLRFLVPFVRTPTNLWRHFEQRIPFFGLFTKQMKDMWNSGSRTARAEVVGRQMMGTATAIYAWHLTQEDVKDKNGNIYRKVTGGGPKDYNIKKQWLNNGWQDYSIADLQDDGTVVYKQYNRMDPRFYALGIAADISENISNINDEDKEDMMGIIMLSAMRSINNKTYLRGVSEAFELIEDTTPNKIERFFGKQVGNIIPYASLVNQGIPGILEAEKDLYEARSFADEIVKKTPFLSKDGLEPRRDILTGEPIEKNVNSIYFNPTEINGPLSFMSFSQGPIMVGRQSTVKSDPVAFELSRLKLSVKAPDKIKEKIVDLTEYKKNGQSAYDWQMEHIGKIKINGKTLKEQLEKQINKISYLRSREGDENFEGGKENSLKKIIRAYKKKAYIEMLKEYPEVKKDVKSAIKKKYGFRKKMSISEIKKEPKELLPRG